MAHKRRNFAAWNVDVEAMARIPDAGGRMIHLVRFGVLAPSSHNSQPWRFSVHDDVIRVAPDRRRALPRSDPDDAQLFASLGCAAACVELAADGYGLRPELGFTADHAWVRVSTEAPAVAPADHPIHALRRRSTNRLAHLTRELPPELVRTAGVCAPPGARAVVVADERRRVVADLVLEGADVANADRGFRLELARYLIPNHSNRSVGMTGETIGLNEVASVVLPQFLKVVNPRPGMRRREEPLLREHTTAWTVFLADQDQPPQWMAAGAAYMRFAARAEALGVTTNNMAAPIGVEDTRRRLASVVGSDRYPMLCVRVGYTDRRMPHAPRLTADKVLGPA